MAINLNLKLEKKHLYLLSAILIFLVGVGVVIALNSGNYQVHGHTADEIQGGGGGGGGQMIAGARGQRWGEVQYSYFGQNQPPYFVFGAYAPSNDWTLWSQTPMVAILLSSTIPSAH